VSASDGLTLQTRRHARAVSLLGVRHMVVAHMVVTVDKMDLISTGLNRIWGSATRTASSGPDPDSCMRR